MSEAENSDRAEIEHFDGVAALWWKPGGKMRELHAINPLRLRFIAEHLSIATSRIVDIGCGGGILSEALARRGARVTAIDLSRPSLEVARRHAEQGGLCIDYRCLAVEALAYSEAATFDAVTCMEMLEHVPHPSRVIASCAALLKPGGVAFFSTINRTLKAFFFAIVAGEYVLGLLPRGTHRYGKLVRPAEMRTWGKVAGLERTAVASLIYNPLAHRFHVAPGREDINYMACFVKSRSAEDGGRLDRV